MACGRPNFAVALRASSTAHRLTPNLLGLRRVLRRGIQNRCDDADEHAI